MKLPIIAAILLILAVPALAAKPTATPEQWKDIHEFRNAFESCGGYTDDPDLKKICARSAKLQKKLTKQGFCFLKRIVVGRTGKRYTQREWERETGDIGPVPKDMMHCYALHIPAP